MAAKRRPTAPAAPRAPALRRETESRMTSVGMSPPMRRRSTRNGSTLSSTPKARSSETTTARKGTEERRVA
jgi:hypothetical protein